MLCIYLLSGMAFIACSGDDDEGAASTDAGVIAGKANVRLTQVGDYRFYYDDKGRIDHILDGKYEGYRFTYDPNKVIWYDTYKDADDEEDEVSISYTSKGYLNKLEASSSRENSDHDWNSTGSSSYTYDGSGHLTKISSSWKETLWEDGEKYNISGNGSTTLTWKNDMLVKVVEEETEYEDGEAETSKSIITFTYDSDNLEDYFNEYYQYTPSSNYLEGMGDGELEEAMAYIGLIGKWSKYLPVSSNEEWEEFYDGRNHTGSNTKNYRYGFNSNGTVSYTTVNSARYSYSYTDSGDDRQNSKSGMKVASKEKGGKKENIVRRLFNHPKH